MSDSTLGEKCQLAASMINIIELWEKLGLPDPPARLGINVRSPFREDGKTGSFHVSRCGKFFRDYGGGGEDKGDGVIFVQTALGCDRKEAMLKFCQLAGVDVGAGGQTDFKVREMKRRPKPVEARELPAMPAGLEVGGDAWRDQLAELRGLTRKGIDLAVEKGFLRFVPSIEIPLNDGRLYKCAAPCWIVLDPETESNAQVRRLDGKEWWDKLKAMTIKGSWASWPIGLVGLEPRAGVLLCEGGPDFLAGFDLLADGCTKLNPVGVLGAGQPLPGGALPLFRDRDVVIAGHHDFEKTLPNGKKQRAGDIAVARWAAQLQGTARRIYKQTGFAEGMDLNDWRRAGGSEVKGRRLRRV